MNTSSPSAAARDYRRGLIATSIAFFIWGLLPLYLKALDGVPVVQITAHRLVWGCVVGVVLVGLRGELKKIRAVLGDGKLRTRLALTASLMCVNWTLYIWGITNDRMVETSLGYFINPLVNVLLGVLVLSERLNPMQWTAVSVAAAGVSYLTWSAGHPPWIALALALSFGLYGLLRKVTQVDGLTGFTSEMLLLLPLGVAYLAWCEFTGVGTFGHAGLGMDLLLALGGPLTAAPLVLFAFGAQRIPYSTVGLLQYIGPTIQLILAVLLFREPFEGPRVLGFSMIWAALVIYASDGVWRARRLAQLR